MASSDKPISFSRHALERMPVRGASEGEVQAAIRGGEEVPAKRGRQAFRKNFYFGSYWKGRYYETKQVMPVVVEEEGRFVVITVYVFYFGGEGNEDPLRQ